MLLKYDIDDPVDAAPIHCGGGLWGILAVAIFSESKRIEKAGYTNKIVDANFGKLLGRQLLGGMVIFTWTAVCASVMFKILKKTIGIRISEQVERDGLDKNEHHKAWAFDIPLNALPRPQEIEMNVLQNNGDVAGQED